MHAHSKVGQFGVFLLICVKRTLCVLIVQHPYLQCVLFYYIIYYENGRVEDYGQRCNVHYMFGMENVCVGTIVSQSIFLSLTNTVAVHIYTSTNIDIFGGLIVRAFGHKVTITIHSMYAKCLIFLGLLDCLETLGSFTHIAIGNCITLPTLLSGRKPSSNLHFSLG